LPSAFSVSIETLPAPARVKALTRHHEFGNAADGLADPAANRDLIHKIGVTTMSVDQRIAGARLHLHLLLCFARLLR
jgi:hypothetical protein